MRLTTMQTAEQEDVISLLSDAYQQEVIKTLTNEQHLKTVDSKNQTQIDDKRQTMPAKFFDAKQLIAKKQIAQNWYDSDKMDLFSKEYSQAK